MPPLPNSAKPPPSNPQKTSNLIRNPSSAPFTQPPGFDFDVLQNLSSPHPNKCPFCSKLLPKGFTETPSPQPTPNSPSVNVMSTWKSCKKGGKQGIQRGGSMNALLQNGSESYSLSSRSLRSPRNSSLRSGARRIRPRRRGPCIRG